jgi:phage tail-like protein
MALLSKTSIRSDPILSHNFVISLIDSSSTMAIVGSAALAAIFDVVAGGFSECSGLEMSLKVEEYREGGRNSAVLKFPTRVEWSNLTLKKGLGTGTVLWDWHYSFVEGRGKRRDGIVALLTDLRVPNNIWYFRRGLPIKYTGPSLNATQNTVAIESLEITHEGIYQLPSVGLGAAAVGAVAGLVR